MDSDEGTAAPRSAAWPSQWAQPSHCADCAIASPRCLATSSWPVSLRHRGPPTGHDRTVVAPVLATSLASLTNHETYGSALHRKPAATAELPPGVQIVAFSRFTHLFLFPFFSFFVHLHFYVCKCFNVDYCCSLRIFLRRFFSVSHWEHKIYLAFSPIAPL